MEKVMETEILKVLKELREGQERQLHQQSEALELQRANFALVKEQFDRATQIQDRAEKIQEPGAQLMAVARKSAKVVVPMILLLLLCIAWLIFRVF